MTSPLFKDDPRYAPGIVDLFSETCLVIPSRGICRLSELVALQEEEGRKRTTGYGLQDVGGLELETFLEYRWGTDCMTVTMLLRNSRSNWHGQNEVLPADTLIRVIKKDTTWNVDNRGPSCVHPFAWPWGQTVDPVAGPEVTCRSGRTFLADMTFTPFRFILSTAPVEELIGQIYAGLGGWHDPAVREMRGYLDVRPDKSVPYPAPLPALARFLESDFARQDELGRHGPRDNNGDPAFVMNGHNCKTGASGSQKRLGWFADGLHVPTGTELVRLTGELLWVHGVRPQNITSLTHHPSNTREGHYFYYSLHRTSPNKEGRPLGTPAYSPGFQGAIQGHNLEHGEDLLPMVAWWTGDFALEMLTYAHAQRGMSTLQTHHIGNGGVFGGGLGVTSGVNARAVWRWLRQLVQSAKVTGDPGGKIMSHVRLKIQQVIDRWQPDNFGSLDTRPDTLIQGQRVPYFDVWQHSLAVWIATIPELMEDAPTVEMLRALQTHIVIAWRKNGATWEMPKRVAASDATFGDAYGSWHAGLVGWASGMIRLRGLLTDPDLETKRAEIERWLQGRPQAAWAIEPIEVEP